MLGLQWRAFCSFAMCLSAFLSQGLAEAPIEQVSDPPFRSHQSLSPDRPDKYFHESTFSEHYDGRFASAPLIYEEHRAALTMLMQTYLSTMVDLGIETWIMHGTLLGWYWNRLILPWDSDIDVMVTEKSIEHLAGYYNMSVFHVGMIDEVQGEEAKRFEYLLEVNPHWKNATEDDVNHIDARFVDMESGLFIDITTLRRNRTAIALGEPEACMVKDGHAYVYDDIFPLRQSEFEGQEVRVPFAYAKVLAEEYGQKALAEVYYQNHRFDVQTGEWRALKYAELSYYLKKTGEGLGKLFWGEVLEQGEDSSRLDLFDGLRRLGRLAQT